VRGARKEADVIPYGERGGFPRPLAEHNWSNPHEAPFFRWAGIRVVRAVDGEAEIELEVEDHHRGGGGTEAINGGIVAYMFDAAMGLAARSTWDDGVRGQVTVTMTVQYLTMLRAEQKVRAVGRAVHRGGTTVFTEAWVTDEAGTVAARATGIYRLFR
jgi:uncharacterized protein (TIGR00369 family)